MECLLVTKNQAKKKTDARAQIIVLHVTKWTPNASHLDTALA